MSHLDKFRVDDLSVYRSSHWVVAVRAKQITPGDLVVLPLVEYEHFDDVSPEAAVDLLHTLGRIEATALSALEADRINVVAAMMKDPFVHFHFFPRFENAVTVFGVEWIDADWPRAITLRDVETSESTLALVKEFYVSELAKGA